MPITRAVLPLHDAGFVFGATITDLCRTFRHQLFRLDDHLGRFRQSCALAGVPQPIADSELAAIAAKLVAHNASLLAAADDLALVLFATPGPVGHYAGRTIIEPAPTLGLHTFPLPFHRWRHYFQEGLHLIVPPTRQLPAECVDPRVKQRSRLHWWQAEQQAHIVDPVASALLLDIQGYVTETAFANFLIVRQGQVLSPKRQRILGGISLVVVEEMCHELNIPFAEMDLRLDDCQRAEEAFVTSSSFCIAPVSRVGTWDLPCPGPLFERLLRHWSNQVGVDIRGQILGG